MCITPRRCIRERAQYILTLNTRQTFRNSHTMVSNRSKKMQVGTVHVSKQWWGSCVMPLSDTERRVDIESLHKRLSVSQGAGKSLARPGRETSSEACQGRARFQQHRDASCHQVFFFLQVKEPKEIHAILIETLASFLLGRAKDLSAPCNTER